MLLKGNTDEALFRVARVVSDVPRTKFDFESRVFAASGVEQDRDLSSSCRHNFKKSSMRSVDDRSSSP
jgi:hypothetical protein